jgi:hypothetical protein
MHAMLFWSIWDELAWFTPSPFTLAPRHPTRYAT